VEEIEIRHRLDLVVRLLDATTGKSVNERDVNFFEGDKRIPIVIKSDGMIIILNTDRVNTVLSVKVRGYETASIIVEYGESKQTFQERDLYLIPEGNGYQRDSFLTICGEMEGIELIDAISVDVKDRTILSFDTRKNILQYLGSELMEKDYGIFHKEEMTFESFRIRRRVNETAVLIEKPLSEPYSIKDAIVRIVKGMVYPGGRYLLRVRNDGTKVVYIVRYIKDGTTYFKEIDFHKCEGRL